MSPDSGKGRSTEEFFLHNLARDGSLSFALTIACFQRSAVGRASGENPPNRVASDPMLTEPWFP